MIGIVAPTDLEFERIVRECYDDVYRFACSLTRASADAADLTQQAFLRFAKKGDQVRDRGKVKSWLFSVLRNEFTDSQRRKKRYPHVEISPAHEETECETTPAAGQADWQTALAALHSLPEPFREPLSLYYLEGYTYREIAEILDLPPGTVMSRLSRGKARLRVIMVDPPATKQTDE